MIRRVLGGLLVLVLAAGCALLEVFYLPLRAGQVLIPLSVVAAVVGNVVFTRAMYAVTSSVVPALLPGVVWLALIARAAIARPEGDLLITDGRSSTALAVINLSFLLLGSLALAYAMRWVSRRRRVSRRAPTPEGHGRASQPQGAAQPPETAGIT